MPQVQTWQQQQRRLRRLVLALALALAVLALVALTLVLVMLGRKRQGILRYRLQTPHPLASFSQRSVQAAA